MGFGLVIRFIDHLQIITTSSYNTIAILHTLQITTAYTITGFSDFVHRPDSKIIRRKTRRFGNWFCFRPTTAHAKPS
jgi:hypothetical protein